MLIGEIEGVKGDKEEKVDSKENLLKERKIIESEIGKNTTSVGNHQRFMNRLEVIDNKIRSIENEDKNMKTLNLQSALKVSNNTGIHGETYALLSKKSESKVLDEIKKELNISSVHEYSDTQADSICLLVSNDVYGEYNFPITYKIEKMETETEFDSSLIVYKIEKCKKYYTPQNKSGFDFAKMLPSIKLKITDANKFNFKFVKYINQ